MILQSLYERDKALGEKLPDGFVRKEIPLIIVIDPAGSLVLVKGLEDGAKEQGESHTIPTPVTRTSGVSPNLFWDHYGYVLGLAKKETEKECAKSRRQMDAFVEQVRQFAKKFPSNPVFQAVKAFYDKEEYLRITQDEDKVATITKKPGANMTFLVSFPGGSDRLVTDEQDLRDYQSAHYYAGQTDGEEAICLITGRKGPISRLHPGIKLSGMPLSLVNFQVNSGYDSYGKSQAYNAPVSPQAAEGYASALNDLLGKGKDTNYFLAGITYVFWTSHTDEDKLAGDFKSATFSPPLAPKEEDGKKRKPTKGKGKTPLQIDRAKCKKVLSTLRAIRGDKNALPQRESEERFYLLALEPGRGRISVKLFVEGTIREIFAHTLQHLEDLKIYGREVKRMDDDPAIPSLYALVGALMPAALKADKWPKRPIEALVRSITTGAPYPTDLYTSCLQRIKAERNVSELRAAYIKGYINRDYRYRHHTEENIITMSLNKNQTNKGYLAGRLFAVLECLQQIANSKATITDSYFGNAMTSPAAVFPYLIRLSIHHQKKAKRDQPGFYKECTKQLDEIMALLGGDETPYPTHFTLEEQGFFSLGYYHQKQYHYSSKEEKEAINNNSSSED